MDPNKTIRTTAAGRRAAAARDRRLERGQEPTRPLMLSSSAPAADASHAPGPWHVAEGRNHLLRVAAGTACVVPDCGDAEVPEHAANARLIAAAPELLDALLACLAVLPYGHEAIDVMARAAISKARGRS